jgi:hypothetical protein
VQEPILEGEIAYGRYSTQSGNQRALPKGDLEGTALERFSAW